jgi:N-acetylmuramoyl-L-alanine amidase
MKRAVIILARRRFVTYFVIVIALIAASAAYIISSLSLDRNILNGKTVVVDAGHGGIDGGANNQYIKEKDINLDIALKLQKKLESNGAKVIMTRTEDVELGKTNRIDRDRYKKDLAARVNIINNSGANLFISIHTNSNRNNPSTRGAIAFYANSHPHNREMAYIFQNVLNTYAFQYNGREYKSHHIPQKGKYYLLTNAKIPGIIIETGFITNSTDLLLLRTDGYKEYLADAICKGISNYLQCSDKLPHEIDDTVNIEEENIIDMADEDKEVY